MENMAVLKKFLSYIVYTVIGGSVFLGVTYLSRELTGQSGYGIIVMLGVFLLYTLYKMAESNVRMEETEARWATERAERLKP